MHRLALVLSAVHAARTQDIRRLQLDDIDLGNRRLTLSGTARPLDDLTHQAHGECGPDFPHCFPPEGVDSDCTEGCPAFELSQEARS